MRPKKGAMKIEEPEIRVGNEYQAIIPDLQPEASRANLIAPGVRIWYPESGMDEPKLDRYIAAAKIYHGYDKDQAFGILFWHKYDILKALLDLPDMIPIQDELDDFETKIFEQAIKIHGKNFKAIQNLLPDISTITLVNHYYSRKMRPKMVQKMITKRLENNPKRARLLRPTNNNSLKTQTTMGRKRGAKKSQEVKPTIRVGEDYQAIIPNLEPTASRANLVTRGLQIWHPKSGMDEPKLDRYITVAESYHGYDKTQAFGILFWHKHNILKALEDLPVYTPIHDKLNAVETIKFERAFKTHGKNFEAIKKVLPDKSTHTLVNHYYSRKMDPGMVRKMIKKRLENIIERDGLIDPTNNNSLVIQVINDDETEDLKKKQVQSQKILV